MESYKCCNFHYFFLFPFFSFSRLHVGETGTPTTLVGVTIAFGKYKWTENVDGEMQVQA